MLQLLLWRNERDFIHCYKRLVRIPTDSSIFMVEKQWNIVHLEDHRIYQKGMQSALTSLQSNLAFRSFQHPDEALQYTIVALARNQDIHLIITDFTQVTGNGYAFASGVREIEKKHGKHIPILLLSMLEPELAALIPLGLRENVFSKYLPKHTDPEEVLTAMNELLRLHK